MHPRDRAVSSVIGYAVLLGIVAFGTFAVLALGGAALTDIQESARTEQASGGIAQFDTAATQAAFGGGGVQSAALGSARGTVSVDDDAGHVTVTHVQTGGDTVLVDETLGAVVYDTGADRVAYQGGGVWKRGPDGPTMVSAPEYHYRGQTLTFPVVRVTGDWSGSPENGLSVRETGGGRLFPTASQGNPLENGHVEVEVTSEYHAAWAEFFRTRTEGSVTHHPDDERVAVDLTVPYEVEFTNGVAATATGSDSIQTDGGATITGPTQVGTDHPTVDGRIEDRVDDCESGGCMDLSTALGSPLENGTYYAGSDTTIDASSYDTSDGPVHVVVDGDLTFKGTGGANNLDHEVTGSSQVRFWVKGSVSFEGNANVNTDGDADDVLVLVHSDAGSVSAASGTPQFTGHVYAPGTDFTIDGTADAIGGLVVQTATASGSAEVQHEPASFTFEPGTGANAAVTYLHVSDHELLVEGDD
jgi:hypothetical protein